MMGSDLLRRSVSSLLSLAVLSILTVAPSHGQAKPAGTGPGSIVTVGAMASGFKLDYGDRYLGGYGAYVDFNPTWRYGIEGEARLLRFNQEFNVHDSTYLVGPRVSFSPHKINPYVKVLVGLGHFNFPFNYATGSYFVIAPGAGVDYRVSERFRVRVVDFEYQEWPQFTFGAIHPYGISSGISFSVARSGTKRGRR